MKKYYLTFVIPLLINNLLGNAITVSGNIVDSITLKPIANVNIITDKGGTNSNSLGEFDLELIDEMEEVTFSHIGYSEITLIASEIRKTVHLTPISLPLEGILVRSGLREVSLLDATSSITIIGSSNLRNEPSQHFQGLTQSIPNLNWAGGTSRPRYFQIRGVGERSLYANEGPPNFSVGFVIDDIDFAGIGMPAILLDINQIEIFRGPQSSVYGANTLAGLISMQSNAPKNQFESTIQTGITSDNGKNIGLIINLPVIENLNTRFTIYSGQENGFRENVYQNNIDSNSKSEKLVRNKTIWSPTSNFQTVITSLIVDQDNKYDVWAPDNNELLQTYSNSNGKDTQSSKAISIKNSWFNTGNKNLISITAYSINKSEHSYDGDWGNSDFWSQAPYNVDGWDYSAIETTLRDRSTFTQEFRLLENINNRSSFVLGIYFKNQIENYDLNGYWGGDYSLAGKFKNLNIAGYFQMDKTLSNEINFIINARLDHNRINYSSSNYYGEINDSVENKDNNWGIKSSVSYKLNPKSNLYLSLSRGFKAGGINQNPYLSQLNRKYGPETNTSYELGFKQYSASIKAQFTIFYMNRANQQVSISTQQDESDPLSFDFFTSNAATGYNYGSELDIDFLPIKNLILKMNIGYLQTYVNPYEYFVIVDGLKTLEKAGNRELAHAPKYTFSVGLNYTLPFNLTVGLALSGKDKFYYSDSHNQQSKAYQLLDLNLDYKVENWSLSAWGKNVLDTRYGVRGFYFGLEPPNYEEKLYIHWGDPIQYGLSVKYHF